MRHLEISKSSVDLNLVNFTMTGAPIINQIRFLVETHGRASHTAVRLYTAVCLYNMDQII